MKRTKENMIKLLTALKDNCLNVAKSLGAGSTSLKDDLLGRASAYQAIIWILEEKEFFEGQWAIFFKEGK